MFNRRQKVSKEKESKDDQGLGECVIDGCSEQAVVEYPLLGVVRFCNKHYTPEYAEPYGCDFSGPDDFDIPI